MPSFLQRIGLKKRKPGKNKLGKTADLPTSAVTRDAESIPAVLAPRRSFDSRASGSIISIPRSVEDFEDFKPWKKKKNKGKQAHRGNADITEQMRRDFIALQHKIDRIEAHVVPKTPPDAFNLDDLNTAVTTNAIRTFVECAMVVYEEGKDPDVLTDSVPETPDDIRNAFVKALERCNDPEFLFRLSQKILQKYSTTYGPKTTDAGPSEQQDLRSDGASEPSSKPMQTILLPQIEYRPRRRHENEVCLSVSRPYRLSPILQQFIPASELKSKPDLIRGELVPVATHLLRTRINAEKRQRGELMPHLPIPFGPSPPPIDQVSNRASQEPKYLGLHDLYAENCIERLENQASEMANLPRTYTENVAVERIGSRPQIEATVSRPNTLTKPDEPCFKSSPEDLSIDDETLDLEILPISRASLTSSLGPLPQKTPHDSRVPLSFTDNPIVLPMSFPDPSFDEVLSEDEEESDVDLGCSIRYDGQNPQQASPLTISEPQLEPGPEEQGMQVLDTDRIRIGGDPCCVSVSSECGFCVDNDQADDGEEEDDRNWDDEAAAHLRAIHLLILLKVLAKRQNESQGSIQTNQSSSSSSRSPTPSDSSEASGSGSNSSTTSQSISVSDSNGTKPGGSSKKRPRENDPNENGNNPNGPPQKKLAIDMIRDTLKRFACPFARGKPNEHSGCQMINRQNLSGLKEHVKRKHFNNVLPNEIRIAKSWNEIFLHCNKNWTGPIPSPYISNMFLTANGSQPFTFEPSSPINDGRYRPIVPLLSSPILGGPTSDTNASELLSQPIVQVHTHNPGNYDARPKASEPTVGEEMFDFLATGGFDSIFHLLPPHIQSINPDELQVPVSLALEDYMQSNFGINVNQTRSQLMTPEFTNNLNMLFQQVQPEVTPQVISEDQPEEVHNQQELVPPGHMTQASSLGTQSTSQAVESLPNPPLPSQPPTIKLHLEKPSYDNINTTTSPPPITTSETPSDKRIPFISPELSHCLDYLFADSKPYLKTQQPKSRLSRSSFSSTSSSSPPSSSSSSLLLPDPDTQTPDTLFSLSERNSLDLPSPPPPRPLNTKASPKSPPKKSPRNKRYSLHIRYKPRTPGSPHQCATFSFNPDNEYIELKLAFNDWMTNTFFSNSDQEFSWNSWELEDTDYHERVPSLEALVQNLPFTWTAFRTTEAAFLLVPKQ